MLALVALLLPLMLIRDENEAIRNPDGDVVIYQNGFVRWARDAMGRRVTKKMRQARSSLCYHWTLREIRKRTVTVTTVGVTFQPTPMALRGPNLILLVLATNRQLSETCE